MSAHRITTLSSQLKAYTSQPDKVPSGRTLYYGAISAKYPAHQVGLIWHFDDADIAVIAAAYGLAPKAVAAPALRASRKTVSAPVSVAA